jgi:UDP-N-acetylglucosamine 3-dehydrogenase
MTRVAVIGVGSMGKNHVRVYRDMPEAELVAVVDQDRAAAEEVSRIYKIPCYADYFEMLEREKPEAVSIVVPTFAHFAVVKDLLEAGCHVLVEKPIAATLDEAHKLIELHKHMDRIFTVGHIERFNPAVTELKRQLKNQKLGTIFEIHARRLGPFPVRIQDAGVVKDLAIHDLDIMQYLTESEVLRVYAEAKRTIHDSCEDMFVGTLRFSNNVIGSLEINWITPTKIRELYVTGERGMYRVNYITQDLYFFENAEANGSDWSALSLLRGVSEGSIVQFAIKKKEPLRAELEAFLAKVQGKEAQLVSGEEAATALNLALALIESSKSGQVYEVKQYGIRSDYAVRPILHDQSGKLPAVSSS